ncbi:MAG TPA: hypothetical protein VIJ34_07305 [Acidimicrobiales bacterium]
MRTAVILDVGGVLLVPDEAIVGQALRGFGLALDDALLSAAHYLAVHYVDDETRALSDRPYEIGYLSALGFAGDELAAGLGAFDELWKLPAIDLGLSRFQAVSSCLPSSLPRTRRSQS